MLWIKRNRFFVGGAIAALGLIGFAGFYNLSGREEAGRPITFNAEIGGAGKMDTNAKTEAATVAVKGDASEIAKLTLRCRAVIPSEVSGDADTTIAYALERALQQSTTLFDPQTTKLGPEIQRVGNADTFTFDVTVGLKRPIKL